MAKRKNYPKAWHVRSFDDRDVEVLPCEVLRSSIKTDGSVIVQISINGSTFRVGEFTVFERRDDAYADARRTVLARIDRLKASMRRLEKEANGD